MMPVVESPLTALRWFMQRMFTTLDKSTRVLWEESNIWVDSCWLSTWDHFGWLWGQETVCLCSYWRRQDSVTVTAVLPRAGMLLCRCRRVPHWQEPEPCKQWAVALSQGCHIWCSMRIATAPYSQGFRVVLYQGEGAGGCCLGCQLSVGKAAWSCDWFFKLIQ